MSLRNNDSYPKRLNQTPLNWCIWANSLQLLWARENKDWMRCLFFQGKGRGRGLHETMKPPFKSKITKIKPLSRRKKDKQESTAWFDSDTLFGFGMDDE